MDFLELVRARRSVRAFKSGPIESPKIEAILEAMNAAPSAGNLQAYQVVQVVDPERRRRRPGGGSRRWCTRAPTPAKRGAETP